MQYELKLYFTDRGTKTVLVGPAGRSKMPVLIMEKGLIVRKVPLSEMRKMRDVVQSERPKSLKKVIKQFRSFGRTSGMSKAAKAFLTQATKAA